MHEEYLETNYKKVNGPVGDRYANYFRLKEPPHEELDEKFVQQLWFEEAYKTTLLTTSGERIVMIQPGFWNHRDGPDFLQACLINEDGEKEIGAVEIHLSPSDWHKHHHDCDKYYTKVILHVVWKKSDKEFFPKNASAQNIRQVELSSQLKLPIDFLKQSFTTTQQERIVGTRPGPCAEKIKHLSPLKLADFLYEAGWHRFHKKQAMWSTRIRLLGINQALWMGLAETLGYSENKLPFRLLAQRLPIDLLLAEKNTEIESLIFGISGFLPQRTLAKTGSQAAKRQRILWDHWWSRRAEMTEKQIPKDLWKLSGIRPINRPERRLAVMVALAQTHTWSLFRFLAENGTPESIEKWLLELSHEFWNTHYTFHSPSKSNMALLGSTRIQSLLFNVILPIQGLNDTTLTWLSKATVNTTNQSARIASMRLLEDKIAPQISRRLLVQEGLVQIYQDFCLVDSEHCHTCPVTRTIESWK